VERDRIERTLAQLHPVERPADQLDALATYVQSLPAAWADADQRQRNEMATILYEEVWVDGPRAEYVKPRPELESLFQSRTGAAQPTKVSIHGGEFSSGDPDGIRTHDLHRDKLAWWRDCVDGGRETNRRRVHGAWPGHGSERLGSNRKRFRNASLTTRVTTTSVDAAGRNTTGWQNRARLQIRRSAPWTEINRCGRPPRDFANSRPPFESGRRLACVLIL
jgi:hypothetical protein